MTPKETRVWVRSGLRVERRADGKAPMIVGHASVFNEWTTLYRGKDYEVREIVRPGAFKNALAEGQDVRALFNHDANFILGRSTSGTLRMVEDSAGLLCEIDPPDTQAARDLLVSIERGDVSGMSFAFTIRAGGDRRISRTENDIEIYERELTDLDLYDVSPVVYPAYPGTDLGMRSLETLGLARPEDLRAAFAPPAPEAPPVVNPRLRLASVELEYLRSLAR